MVSYSGDLLSSVAQVGGMLVSGKSGCVIRKYLRGLLSSAVQVGGILVSERSG